MVEKLVDQETWFKCCAMGSAQKPPLDPNVMSYVENRVFHYHPLKAGVETYKQAWQDCITSIDNRGRDLKRRLKKQVN